MSTSVRLDDDDSTGDSSPKPDEDRPVLRGSWDDPGGEDDKPETTTTSHRHALQFEDHYSLGLTPSASVVFRGRRIQVYESHEEQFLLEEQPQSSKADGAATTTLKVRRISTTSFGQTILRVSYTIIAVLFAGFLFVFCFQIVLFVLMNLPVHSGASRLSDLNGAVLAGTFFAIPVLLHGMSRAMALATAFCADLWQGGPLVRSLTGWSDVVREWVAFGVFVGVPALAMIVLLLSQRNNWWEIAALVWISCVALAYAVFSMGVVVREVLIGWRVVAEHDAFFATGSSHLPQQRAEGEQENAVVTGDNDGEQAARSERAFPANFRGWKEVLHRSFLISQSHRYAGMQENGYTVTGASVSTDVGASNGYYSFSQNATPTKSRRGLYSRLVGLSCLKSFFETLDPPQRLFTAEEIRDVEPFLTRYNWGLEKMCCRDSHRSTIIAASGPASLRHKQVQSSFACSVIGSILILLLLAGFLVWNEFGAVAVVLVTLLTLLFCLGPMIKDAFTLYRTYQRVYTDENEDTNIFQIWETVCVSRPRPWLCYASFVVELVLFFLWPLGTLYKNNSISVATLFLIVAVIAFFRIYFNAGSVLAQTGMVAFQRRSNGEESSTSKEQVIDQARTSEIIGKITESRSVARWMYIFGVVSFLVYIAYVVSIDETSDVSPSTRPEILFATDFYYPKNTGENLAYPSCELTNVFREEAEDAATTSQLIDFSFLSARKSVFLILNTLHVSSCPSLRPLRYLLSSVAYEKPENAQVYLDTWFGRGLIIDESDFVAAYRSETKTDTIPVWYKLFRVNTTQTNSTIGIVSVRGSETKIDWLVNCQLWLPSGMAEIVNNMVPFSSLFYPIVDNMVTAINVIESESLKKVSYYSAVARFCRDMLDLGYFDTLRLTGASLGGGTAIIAGAQTGVPTIAISGMFVFDGYVLVKLVSHSDSITIILSGRPQCRAWSKDLRSQTFHESAKYSCLQCHSGSGSYCPYWWPCTLVPRNWMHSPKQQLIWLSQHVEDPLRARLYMRSR